MKHFLRFKLYILLLTLTLPFAGCTPNQKINNSHSDPSGFINNANVSPQYEIIDKNGEFYIVFDEATMSDSFKSQNVQLGSVKFSSVEEFKKTVEEKSFDRSQLSIIYKSFSKNSEGMIKICNIKDLRIPQVASEVEYSAFHWRGETYSYYLQSSSGVNGYFHCYTDEIYEQYYATEYVDFFSQDTIRVTKEEWEEERNADIYYYSTSQASSKKIRYILFNEANNETLIIDEKYILSLSSNLLPTSESVPYSIEIYGGKSGSRFVIYLNGFTERPSVEWLMQFGTELYKE